MENNSNVDTNLGLKTSGEDLNWKNLNNNHEDNSIVTALIKDSEKLFNEDVNESEVKINNDLIEEFNKFLNENKLGNYFENLNENQIELNENNTKKKTKKEKISKKDLLKINIEKEKNKKDIQKFLLKLSMDSNKKHYPLKKNKLYESFLNIIYWVCYLIKNKKSDIELEIYFDCAISFYRAIKECKDKDIINEPIINVCNTLLDKIQDIIKKRNNNHVYELCFKYYYLITSSYWDSEKPNNVTLYDEQKDAILNIQNALKNDNPLLMFYWVPPANGKTLVSTIIAKNISKHNKEICKIKPETHRKILLYICYNDIVRNSVSSLCVTHNVDIKFWLATYHKDKYKNIYLVDFRPYKNCFPDWRKKKSPKLYKKDEESNDKRYSPDLRTQMYQYLDETRPLSIREKEIKNKKDKDIKNNNDFILNNKLETCQNLPEMIISDLDSAYEILKEFPDLFIPYFDEAFAASNQIITSKIMSVLPKISILISATLATPDKIPTILNNFKNKHNATDDNIKYIYSNKQHINCDFISPDGDIISPHHNLNDCSEIENFIKLMDKNPLIQRGYSNLIVLDMYLKLRDFLPDDFNSLFNENLGAITNTRIRDFGRDMLYFCKDNNDLFNIINKISVSKIKDNNINNIFTKNSYIYHDHNTLHVSNPINYVNYICELTNDFLNNSPKLKNIISDFNKKITLMNNEIKNIEKNCKADNKLNELTDANKRKESIKFEYPNEFIVNSFSHLKKFNEKNKINNYRKQLFDIDVISNLDDLYAKLFLSSIGVYNQSDLTSYELQIFLKYKDTFKFILADPSIIYGTNISLTLIDINENLTPISTRNTLYQLIGRSGRKGKSSSATIIFRSMNLFNIIVEDNDNNEEAANIENNLIDLLK